MFLMRLPLFFSFRVPFGLFDIQKIDSNFWESTHFLKIEFQISSLEFENNSFKGGMRLGKAKRTIPEIL